MLGDLKIDGHLGQDVVLEFRSETREPARIAEGNGESFCGSQRSGRDLDLRSGRLEGLDLGSSRKKQEGGMDVSILPKLTPTRPPSWQLQGTRQETISYEWVPSHSPNLLASGASRPRAYSRSLDAG